MFIQLVIVIMSVVTVTMTCRCRLDSSGVVKYFMVVVRTQLNNENCVQAQYQKDAGSILVQASACSFRAGVFVQTLSPFYYCIAIDLVPSSAS